MSSPICGYGHIIGISIASQVIHVRNRKNAILVAFFLLSSALAYGQLSLPKLSLPNIPLPHLGGGGGALNPASLITSVPNLLIGGRGGSGFDPRSLQTFLDALNATIQAGGKGLQSLWDKVKIPDVCEEHKCVSQAEADANERAYLQKLEVSRDSDRENANIFTISSNRVRLQTVEAAGIALQLRSEHPCAVQADPLSCLADLNTSLRQLEELERWVQSANSAADTLKRRDELVHQVERLHDTLAVAYISEHDAAIDELLGPYRENGRSLVNGAYARMKCSAIWWSQRQELSAIEDAMAAQSDHPDVYVRHEVIGRIVAAHSLLEVVDTVCGSQTESVRAQAQRLFDRYTPVNRESEAVEQKLLKAQCTRTKVNNKSTTWRGCGELRPSDDFLYSLHLAAAQSENKK